MEHVQEEQLILHYYGEAERPNEVDEHLRSCAACRSEYATLQRLLNTVDSAPVPERAPDYSAQVWSRVEPKLGFRKRWKWMRPLVGAIAMAGLVVGAFFAGRHLPSAPTPTVATGSVREKVLLVAVSDHLERSRMMLIELANAPTDRPYEMGPERTLAENLVESNRLFRQTAMATGEQGILTVLDDLERVLIDIAHSPDQLQAEQLEAIRRRMEQQNLLFKVRVLGTKLKAQEGAPLL